MNTRVCFSFKGGILRSSVKGISLQDCQNSTIHESVNQIEVRWKGIDDKFSVQFASFLRRCTFVKSIDLADNYIGDSGCKELAESLSQLAHLKRLVLSGNRLGDLGFAIVSSMLTVNSTVIELDLSGNSVRKTGMQALGSGLRENASLLSLKLDELFFGDDGAGLMLFDSLVLSDVK